MLEQYRRIKKEHRDDVLFFRLGDFYEMFAEDAIEVSSLLNLTLTSRNGLPMCGVPWHASRSYIARLLRAGKKVAVCEQVSEPGAGKGIVDRRVVEVITPGTTVDEDYLDGSSANHLAVVALVADRISFAYMDPSTGDFRATSFPAGQAAERLRRELERTQPRELIAQESLLEENPAVAAAIADRPSLVLDRWPDWLFDAARGAERLESQFAVANLKGFGLDRSSAEVVSAGVLLRYLDDTARSLLPHVRGLVVYGDDDFVGIDESSQRNLELVRNLRDGEARFTLLETLDETRCSMGLRLLKRWIVHPLRDPERIRLRLDAVEALYRSQARLSSLREVLSKTGDLQRLCSRVGMDRAHAKDLVSIRTSLAAFERTEAIADELALPGTAPADAAERLRELRDLLERGIDDDPSILLTEGNLIRPGFDAELDALRRLKDDGRSLLEAYLQEERAATGIGNLKIRYNRMIGYFFEVTKANLSAVPARFVRRQGVVGGERFTTDRLAQLESDLNGASERVTELEKTLFIEMRDRAKNLIVDLLLAAGRIAELDATQSLARAATVRGWTKPIVNDGLRLRIAEGRHPVVEAHLPRGEFVPNDAELDAEGVPFVLLTGPNMAGKSTYLRQTALIVLMAQIGSFVPAHEAEIGVVDRVFCRVGASDNLARGESTFLVEMNETANILRSATRRSLVIMDEVGRGTGTSDGLSIAWAVSEELLDNIGCRTLFATHYHELSAIDHPRMVNMSMEVLEREGEIVFARKLRGGAATESYGLHVARLAGLPESVVERARVLARQIKRSEREMASGEDGDSADRAAEDRKAAGRDVARGELLLAELESLDLERTTPLGALAVLDTWKRSLAEGGMPAPARRTMGRKKRNGPEEGPALLFD
ncbi:MAG TPA: DNA mismatch repair protein MutS [Treponema sp.]|nr:MAG: DNA mismatch repair protein MutS [Treponema sp. GWC1_61_84]OHE76774.1 MAG: DNA mismatch repair protein MutS [Treponema sp. RIFOXYC1_FULL_61_9]HCM28372.1 DNA mismatch repair protein MutS [Treponema sp.]